MRQPVGSLFRSVVLAMAVPVLVTALGCATARRTTPDRQSSRGQVGIASWYGEKYRGKSTASGEPFDPDAMTAAHPSWPFGTCARVVSLENDLEVVVRINDRGPFVRGRVIDLSRAAAEKLNMIGPDLMRVRVEKLD